MDFHLKQWRDRHESEQQPSAKMPKLLLDPHQPSQQQPQPQQQKQHPLHPSESASALSLLVPAETNSKIISLSACSDSNTAAAAAAATTRFPRMGSYFSLAQWQELELQALIYRYLLAGAAVPPELLQPIRKSLLHSSPYFLHHHPLHPYSHYQPALMLQAGYWGRAAMDPEPGRCRRTDGKKWRCSRDVVAGHKYCERHVHRGRNRSRKPVEIPTPASATATTTTTATTTIAASLANGGGGTAVGADAGGGGLNSIITSVAAPSQTAVANGTAMFSLTGQSPSINLLDFSNGASDSKPDNKNFIGSLNDSGNRPDGRVLRHFFDDWPRSVQDSDNAAGGGSNASPMNSATCLSISMPGNTSSDVSLKLSTGDGGEEPGGTRGVEREPQPHLNWAAGWGTNQVTIASMGGPLAEVLRSSTSNSSPTSVLHQLPRGSASETSIVST